MVWKQLFNFDPLVIICERKLPAHSKCQVLYFQSSTKKWVTSNDHISLKNEILKKMKVLQWRIIIKVMKPNGCDLKQNGCDLKYYFILD